MRKLLWVALICFAIGIGNWVTPARADITVNLQAVWNANTEPDFNAYRFFWKTYNGVTPSGTGRGEYWKDAAWSSTGPSSNLAKTPKLLLFPVSLTPTPDTGTLEFSLTAVDTVGNQSPYSSPYAQYLYNIDVNAPAAPTGLVITKP